MRLRLRGEFFNPGLVVEDVEGMMFLTLVFRNRAGLNDWIYERAQKASS